LLTQGEELPEFGAAREAELAKLRRDAEELARTKKRLLAVQHEAEIQKQKAEVARLQEELCALKAKQSLSFSQPSPEYTIPNQSNFTERTEFFTLPLRTPLSAVTLSLTLSCQVLRIRTFIPFAQGLGTPSLPCLGNSNHSMATNLHASPTSQILEPIRPKTIPNELRSLYPLNWR
jgi:hypothetical protein